MAIYDYEVDNPKRLFGLDLLRALAISFVILAHFLGYGATGDFFGFIGVEVFFVLSGFLIGTVIIKAYNKEDGFRLKQVKEFWIRRWFRTLPNYYLCLIVFFILFSVFYYHQFIFKQPLPYLFFLQSFTNSDISFFRVTWSLAIEEWFYLSFPLVLLIVSKFKFNKHKTLWITTAVFIFFFSMLRVLFDYYSWWGIRGTTILRLDSIAFGVIGAIVCYYYQEFWQKYKGKFVILGTILLALCCLGYYFKGGFFSKTFLFSLFSISFLLLLPFLYYLPRFNNASSRFIVHISLISYSLYLTHWFIISVLIKLNINPLLRGIIILVLMFTVATILYRVYEKPMTAIRDKFGQNIKRGVVLG